MNAMTFGTHTFDLAVVVGCVLAIVVVFSMTRLIVRHMRTAATQRAATWRVAVLVLAQPVCAALLYFALLPPTTPGEAGTLVVATAETPASALGAGQGGDAVVALPEAPALAGVERAPDLGTALRRHPGMQRIRVLGAGLEARDREAVHGDAVAFVPNALKPGLIELDAPVRAIAGGTFRIDGRAHGLRGGSAELRDPAGLRVDRAALNEEGRFTLSATTRVPGAATFTLRLRDAAQRVVEEIALPLEVEAQPAPRALLLAGAPGPEIKYLRRWARDAGIALQVQMSVGGGAQLGDAPIALNATSLKGFDLVILDDRAWSSLGEGQRVALTDALHGGLGVLLRVTAALSESEQRRLRALGFAVDAGRDAVDVHLLESRRDDDALRARIGPGTRDQARSAAAPVPESPALTRRTLRVAANDGIALLRDQGDQPLALWRAEGRGRVAVWPLTDTYRLVLAGRDDLHAETWSDAVATLARAQSSSPISVEGESRVGERVALCGLSRAATVASPSGKQTPLSIDPASGTRACAAYWPREAGWHQVTSQSRTQRFNVRAVNEAPNLHANLVREATLRLAAESSAANSANAANRPVPQNPGERWPWWLAWLLASAALWWFERARIGFAKAS
ncbi:carboxypeptidase regulatory-like domain-containing protein [Noviluteimonas gilva]|uniref:Carboxypeptidase regulatory-like domain-containing protein n=1 Tax=Noviluteimonas gilva TaxID=2682097 RepID=A0A7C9HTW9_9GAMM|nr:carboxypeptidase regulatory-like domain-containing protein [Lysobacter gilvus]MUV14751.1 carboxypeptidase regulatory-like domain-containing protein [Lysobacter gilvus]